MSVFGGEIQNWTNAIFTFSSLVGPPAECDGLLSANTNPSTI